jgi:thioredoxin-like negative regulator of GroEL
MKEESASLAARVRETAGAEPASQIRKFYDLVFGREPESREMGAARKFLESRPADTALPEFAQVLLSSSEFSFVD